MKRIALGGKKGKGLYALVDDEDHEKVARYPWHLHSERYAAHTTKEQTIVLMHHMIIGKPAAGLVTDHRDDNGLNNQRHNLRHCTHAQNIRNSKLSGLRNGKPTSSKYRGVKYNKKDRAWHAALQCNGKKYWGGSHRTEEEAALAYNVLATKYHGEYARLNDVSAWDHQLALFTTR